MPTLDPPNTVFLARVTDAMDSISRLVRPEVRALKAYHVPDSRGYVKLDAMENPYTWPDSMVNEWLEALRDTSPNRYPDPACEELKSALKVANDVPPECELLLGNGSDEIIQILLMALNPGATVMAPEPTFVMYRQIANSLGLNFVGVPLNPSDFSMDLVAFTEAVVEHDPALIFLAYPNNPTANLFDRQAMEAILKTSRGLVVVDEAYAPYASASYMGSLREFPRLLVMRTLSKLGLAGLRLGFLAGTPAWINEFEKLRLPYNINVLTQKSALFALSHQATLDQQVAAILSERTRLMSLLQEIKGLHLFDSSTNFILLRLEKHPAGVVFEQLKSQGVLIKNLDPQGGPLKGCLRVTVGTPEENDRFLEAFRSILG
jgi:histidinol-phosphate aminotransferase